MTNHPALKSVRLPAPYADVELAFTEWGPAAAGRTVLCVHGLTRNSRDFDELAQALSDRGARVIAVDIAGRGRSPWLQDPTQYTNATYAAHLTTFLSTQGLTEVDWIGTSMGGLIGMSLAAQPAHPIRRLALNDVGPFVPAAALGQIKQYLGLDLTFDSLADLEGHLRLIHAGFGNLTDEQWHHLAKHSARQTDGHWKLGYDPAIRVPYEDLAVHDVDMWAVWDSITCPTFVLRGQDSPVLTAETAADMERRGPLAKVVELEGIGHAPALMTRDQIEIVGRWLDLPA